MVSLNFSVDKTRIRLMMADSVTSGCVNTVVCHFSYDESYRDMDRIAVFENEHTAIHIPLNDLDECLVPASMLESTTPVYIGLLGISGAEEKTLTTGRARVNIFPGVNKEASKEDGNTPTILESLYTIVAETKKLAEDALENAQIAIEQSNVAVEDAGTAISLANSVRTDANNGKFTPKKGVDYFTTAEINSIKNEGKVTVAEYTSRHDRSITIYQNGKYVNSFACAGKKNGSGSGQSWYLTDYSNSTVSGDFSAMLGFRNLGFGNGNLVSGIDNDISGRAVLAGGYDNYVSACAEGALIAGRHTRVNDSNTVFSLGLGYNSQIDILTNGNIRFKINSSEFTITPAKLKEVFGV